MLRTGLPALDAPWGGLTPGESYLLVGRLGAGRAALALQIARAVADEARCLYLSTRAPQALAESAAQAGYDLAAAYRAGQMRLMQIPPAAQLAAAGSEGLADAYADLIGLVSQERPAAVVVEDFTPLVQFDAFERFEAAFAELRDTLRAQGVALVLGIGEPANDASRQLLSLLSRRVDGTIRLEVLDGGTRRLVLSRADAPTAPAPSAAAPDAPGASNDNTANDTDVPAAPPAAIPPAAPAEPDDFGPQNDGAASGFPQPAIPAPESYAADAGFAPEVPAGPFGPDTFTHDPITSPSGPQPARILPAPPPDASLSVTGMDAFAEESTRSLVDQGYLIDSREQPAPAPDADEAFALAPLAPEAPAPPSRPALLSTDAFAQHLDALFAARRETGTPFLVVALRMEPGAAQAVHFPLIVEGVCAQADGRACLADEARCRAVVLLPDASPDSGQALFGALQQHLQRHFGETAADVLRAVGAVTLPNGEPFADASALLGYAYAS